MRERLAAFLLTALIVGCGDGSGTHANEPDGTPSPEGGVDAAETPISWTRTYTSASARRPGDVPGRAAWQSGLCTTGRGDILFPGIAEGGAEAEYPQAAGVLLSPEGEETWRVPCTDNVYVFRDACGDESFAFAGAIQRYSDHATLGGGELDISGGSEFIAGVDATGKLKWGAAYSPSTVELLPKGAGWTWLVGAYGPHHLNCESIPQGPDELSTAIVTLDADGNCAEHHRVKMVPGIGDAMDAQSATADSEGTAILLGNADPVQDMAAERLDNDGNLVWSTSVYPQFASQFHGSIYRSNGDRGYFLVGDKGGSSQTVVVKLSSDGAEEWNKTVAEFTMGQVSAMAPDVAGGILLGGVFMEQDGAGTAKLCGQTFTPDGEGDGFLMRLDDQGNCSWIRMFDGPLFQQVDAVATSAVDETIVVAWEDWSDEAWQSDEYYPMVNLHITKFKPE